ncbi:MAG: histidinol-phosphate transaminase [Oscillospiraceae bacterium]|jgi:histidinol-phosphate aminotransferase|nr:histidinol-phosphate transaminase [Oscillospiraceae bacterium]
MAFKLNEKIKDLKPYDPICGEYEVRLDSNESFILPPQDIREKILKALQKVDLNRYPDSKATEVCAEFARLYDLAPDLVVAGNGSDELISVIMTAFLQKGDKVVTLKPDFSMYNFYAGLIECKCIEVEKDENFKADFDLVIKTVNDCNARAVIFSNPCNPTSVGFCAQDIRRLIKNTKALIVLDEAYMDFWDQSLLGEVEEYDNLIILKTCSKALGFAAVRLGFSVSNKRIADIIRAVKSPYNVNSLTQAAVVALLGEKQYINDCNKRIRESVKHLYTELKGVQGALNDRIKVFKTNTNFVLVKTDQNEELFEYLKSSSIIVRKFRGFVRITAGSKDENALLISKFKDYYKVG